MWFLRGKTWVAKFKRATAGLHRQVWLFYNRHSHECYCLCNHVTAALKLVLSAFWAFSPFCLILHFPDVQRKNANSQELKGGVFILSDQPLTKIRGWCSLLLPSPPPVLPWGGRTETREEVSLIKREKPPPSIYSQHYRGSYGRKPAPPSSSSFGLLFLSTGMKSASTSLSTKYWLYRQVIS